MPEVSVLGNLLAFVVVVGILVTFHEYGHFWVARRLGVKVLRFSVGFGRPLWRRVAGADQVEYVIAAIPLGGYVKMLDEREGPVPEDERPRAFNRQPVWKRMAIVAAGPIANFVLAVLAFWAMYLIGVNGIRPVVGEVVPDSVAAQAGVRPGDEILSINGEQTPTWQSVSLTLLDEALSGGTVRLELADRSQQVRHAELVLREGQNLLDKGDLLEKLGIKPWRPEIEPVIGGVVAGGSAEQAGLKPGDRIVAVDGQPVKDWSAWVDVVRSHPDQDLTVTVERGGARRLLVLHPAAERDDGEVIGRIGAYPKIDKSRWAQLRVTVRYGPVVGLGRALEKTWDVAALTVRVLWKLVIGEASLSNISGPVTIAEFAGMSAAIGVSAFLGAMALFSVSIGILNLLPVPVLDGGHLLFYTIEWIKGSPVSETTEALGQRIGLALLAALMALALYNDMVRLLD